MTTTSDRPRFAVVTIAEDIHAYAFRQAMQERHGETCAIVETDRFADSRGLSWSPTEDCAPTLPSRHDGAIDVRALRAIWWRRAGGTSWRWPHQPHVPAELKDEAAAEVVVNDCRTTFYGIALTAFRGAWVSHPEATRTADNKLVQLQAARAAGLRVPRTLVSQNPEEIRRFCAGLGNRVILKTVYGTHKAPLTPGQVDPALLGDDRALGLSPAIYQEIIPGTRHLRVHAFGDDFYAASIRCEHLDWRYHLDECAIEPHALAPALAERLRQTLRRLRLRMGVIDMKLTPEGEPVWLEVNPQGQFLFIEGLAPELQLMSALVDFVHREAGLAEDRRLEAVSA